MLRKLMPHLFRRVAPAGRLLASGAFAILAAASVPREAWAFCRTTTEPAPADFSPETGECWTQGKALFWRSLCNGYSVQKDGTTQFSFEDAERLTREGFESWSKVTCPGGDMGPSLFPVELAPAICRNLEYTTGGPNANVVIFRDEGWPHSDSFNTVALTTVTFNADTGEIYDADIEVNTYSREFSTTEAPQQNTYDYLSAITHEAGHFMGLAHSPDQQATMFALYRPGTIAIRTLSEDDIAGICTVYPSLATRPTAAGDILATYCDPTPRGGFAAECAADAPPTPAPTVPKCSAAPALGATSALDARTASALGFAMLALAAVSRRAARRPRRG